jgi:GTPase Era involved in 16S rRNA processing
MDILFLCGVTQAGKSTTIRYSVKFLNVDKTTEYKFLHPREYQNPTKTIEIDGKTVCIYIDSPQEACEEPEKAVEYLKDKIESARKKNADLLVLAFNISEYQNKKTDACLNWIDSSGYKIFTYLTYLDSNTSLDAYARVKIESIKRNGFNVLHTIIRTNPDEQGKIFAGYIMSLL